jgi:hypothetical protein
MAVEITSTAVKHTKGIGSVRLLNKRNGREPSSTAETSVYTQRVVLFAAKGMCTNF